MTPSSGASAFQALSRISSSSSGSAIERPSARWTSFSSSRRSARRRRASVSRSPPRELERRSAARMKTEVPGAGAELVETGLGARRAAVGDALDHQQARPDADLVAGRERLADGHRRSSCGGCRRASPGPRSTRRRRRAPAGHAGARRPGRRARRRSPRRARRESRSGRRCAWSAETGSRTGEDDLGHRRAPTPPSFRARGWGHPGRAAGRAPGGSSKPRGRCRHRRSAPSTVSRQS